MELFYFLTTVAAAFFCVFSFRSPYKIEAPAPAGMFDDKI
jgi:hypothetical protein